MSSGLTEWEYREIAEETEKKRMVETKELIERINAAARAGAGHALKHALEEVGKYSWTSTDQRAAAIHGYMTVYAAHFTRLMEDRPR